MKIIKCEKCGSEDLCKVVKGTFVGSVYADSDGDIEEIQITDDEDVTGFICEDCGYEHPTN